MLFLFLWGSVIAFGQPSGDNSVAGRIRLPNSDRTVVKGSGYNKDGSPIMHSDHPLAQMDRSVIVSLHPVSFQLELKPTTNAYMTQREQTFIPHVLPLTKGSTVYFMNEDEFFHNIYSLTPGSRFNIGRRPPGSPYPIQINKAGPIRLSCDIHDHMSAIILSLETPYYTRIDEQGRYRLEGLADGKYRLRVYHPKLAPQELMIDLRDGAEQIQNFDLTNSENP